MSETGNLNLLDSVTTVLRKMFESQKTKKNPKLEEQIAMYEKIAEKTEKMVYAKTAEAQLEAKMYRNETNTGISKNYERSTTRVKSVTKGKNTIPAQKNVQEMTIDD